MRVVSFDVGITHLAYTVVEFPDDSKEERLGEHGRIEHLQLMDLRSDLMSEPLRFNESRCCQRCDSPAMYGREVNTDLFDYVCGRHRGSLEWTKLAAVSVRELSVQDIHQRLFMTLQMELPHLWPLDVLLIEHQPTSCGRGAQRTQTGVLMKTVGTMLYSFFLCQDMQSRDDLNERFLPSFRMHFVHAADRWYIPEHQLPRPDTITPSGTVPETYKDRKSQSAAWFLHLLQSHPQWCEWMSTCQRLTRIHDVADAFFMAMGFYLKSSRKKARVRK